MFNVPKYRANTFPFFKKTGERIKDSLLSFHRYLLAINSSKKFRPHKHVFNWKKQSVVLWYVLHDTLYRHLCCWHNKLLLFLYFCWVFFVFVVTFINVEVCNKQVFSLESVWRWLGNTKHAWFLQFKIG